MSESILLLPVNPAIVEEKELRITESELKVIGVVYLNSADKLT
ncbi:MAG: hypothetical protein QMD21_01335 [Candidatus Thermoplasmatota archaeon]|nr:hypothetical protein [Candidatus Thermoplasmatota archaeon]MDI6855414.1 hypothetical protein [Candidatus Thermoplasmatota archaeon]